MPQTTNLKHEIAFSVGVKQAREALTTRNGLLGWNTSHVAGDGAVGSEWVLSYPGRADFAWRVDRADDLAVTWTLHSGTGRFGRHDGRIYPDTAQGRAHACHPHSRGLAPYGG
jgi:hypothetical protein